MEPPSPPNGSKPCAASPSSTTLGVCHRRSEISMRSVGQTVIREALLAIAESVRVLLGRPISIDHSLLSDRPRWHDRSSQSGRPMPYLPRRIRRCTHGELHIVKQYEDAQMIDRPMRTMRASRYTIRGAFWKQQLANRGVNAVSSDDKIKAFRCAVRQLHCDAVVCSRPGMRARFPCRTLRPIRPSNH